MSLSECCKNIAEAKDKDFNYYEYDQEPSERDE